MLLRQSTAVVIQFGPFVDKTDGVVLETGLVSALDHASTGILLSKNGGTLTIRHASVSASSYDAHGCYKVTLDTTDTNTLGSIRVIYTDAATCLPVWADFMVVTANEYDSMCSTAIRAANVTQLLGTAWLTPGVAGTPDVNAKQHGGTPQTGRDIGLSVLLSPGTGTGQVSLTSGAVTNVLNIQNAPPDSAGTTTLLVRVPSGAIAAIKIQTDLLPSDPADASDIAALFVTVNTKLDTIDDFCDTEVAAIKAKTDNLPADPADASDIAALFSTVNTKLDAIDDYVDTEVAAIKAKTDLIPAAPAAVGDIPTATQNADALLKRDWTSVTGEAARSLLNAVRFLRNKWSVSGTTLTVCKEDDSTSAWTGTLTTDAAADPITGNDPS